LERKSYGYSTFDAFIYEGIIVKKGTPCYIIDIRKDIRKALNKQPNGKKKVDIYFI